MLSLGPDFCLLFQQGVSFHFRGSNSLGLPREACLHGAGKGARGSDIVSSPSCWVVPSDCGNVVIVAGNLRGNHHWVDPAELLRAETQTSML